MYPEWSGGHQAPALGPHSNDCAPSPTSCPTMKMGCPTVETQGVESNCESYPTTKSEGTVLPRAFSLLIPTASSGDSPKPLSSLVICWKDSQNSLRAAVPTTMVYDIKDPEESQPREPPHGQVQEGSVCRDSAVPSHGITQVTSCTEYCQPSCSSVQGFCWSSITHSPVALLSLAPPGGRATPAPKP